MPEMTETTERDATMVDEAMKILDACEVPYGHVGRPRYTLAGRLTWLKAHLRELRETEKLATSALDSLGVPRVREVTGETISDEQIEDIERMSDWWVSVDGRVLRLSKWIFDALHAGHDAIRDRGRRACAEVYNALPDSERRLTLAERIRWMAEHDVKRIHGATP